MGDLTPPKKNKNQSQPLQKCDETILKHIKFLKMFICKTNYPHLKKILLIYANVRNIKEVYFQYVSGQFYAKYCKSKNYYILFSFNFFFQFITNLKTNYLIMLTP